MQYVRKSAYVHICEGKKLGSILSTQMFGSTYKAVIGVTYANKCMVPLWKSTAWQHMLAASVEVVLKTSPVGLYSCVEERER